MKNACYVAILLFINYRLPGQHPQMFDGFFDKLLLSANFCQPLHFFGGKPHHGSEANQEPTNAID